MAGKPYRYIGKAYTVPDGHGRTLDLHIVQMKENGCIHIEWSAVSLSEALTRWQKFKKNRPRPATAADARALIKDFQKIETEKNATTNSR